MSKAYRRALVLIFGMLVFRGANAQPFEYKGIVLGQQTTVGDLEQKNALQCNTANRSQYGIKCFGKTTLFGKPGTTEVDVDNQNRVTRIHIRYTGNILAFKDMVRQMAGRFGRPYGFTGYTAEWRRKMSQDEQQWVKLQPNDYELRIVRFNMGPNPARVLHGNQRGDF
jgi:hypothetical protein